MADDVSCEGEERQNLAPGGSPEEGHSLKLIENLTGGGEEDYDTGKGRAVMMKTEVVCSSNRKGLLRCSKAFESQTRALLDEQDSNKNKITSNLKNDGSEGGVSEKSTASEALCPVCSKSFRSKKAMYGHMRCHPEREWRGINPPPSAKTDSCSTVSQKNDDLSPSAMKSTVVSSGTIPSQPLQRRTKAGRGQNHPLSSSSSSVPSTDLSLSHKHGVKNKNPVPECLGEKKRQKVEVLQLECLRNYPLREVNIDGRGTLMLKEKASIDTELGPRDAGLDNNMEQESGSKNTKDRSKNGNKLDQEIVSESLPVAPREHKCSTCDKVFPSFQALGGHRSGHRYKNNLQTMDAREEASKGGSKVVVDGFECNICSKNFRSGQALGGHKRTHFQGLTQATRSRDLASGKASKSMGKKVLGFDLNELPRMEE